jgi:peptidyl-prolyl cis-trans isomerase C
MLQCFVLLGVAAPLLAGGATAGQTNAGAASPLANPDTLFTNSVVAKGKGVSVTRAQLDEELIRLKANAAAQGRMLPPNLEPQVLDGLITRQLVLAKATAADKAKGKEDFYDTLKKIKEAQKLTDEEFDQRLAQQLQLLGLTKAEWEQQSIDQATLPVVLERELNITVSDAQAKKFYEDNPAKFEQPEMVRAAHILLLTTDPTTHAELSEAQKAAKKKEMEGILKRARAGEDFGKLAKEYSEDPGSKDNGGEYTFPRGRMVPEFEAAAFSLNTNQISDIITTPYGYHIIKLYEKIPAKKVEFDKVEPDIKEYLKQQDVQKLVADYVRKLKKAADVQILDDKLKLADMPEPVEPLGPGGSTGGTK